MASVSGQPAALSAEQAKVVLAEVIQAFSVPENAVRMDEARDNACNDMGKMLQFVLPVATQIQQEVIKAYGFSCDGEGGPAAGRQRSGRRSGGPELIGRGVLKFARLVKSYEAQDPEIASLSGKLKALFLPPMTLPPHGPPSGGSVAAS
ncbi:protein C10 isoform X1 [Heterocephalus glaber]|uniref:Protein C10 n=1 Tax=Heterocephalus glaber TaxID=10181 RepID=A0AAX6QA63_HETGA|nr:protein C10 isoform X1 [Heterocephalus glaber]